MNANPIADTNTNPVTNVDPDFLTRKALYYALSFNKKSFDKEKIPDEVALIALFGETDLSPFGDNGECNIMTMLRAVNQYNIEILMNEKIAKE